MVDDGRIDDKLLAAYDYELPPELIAQQAAAVRDQSRLLVVDREQGTIEHQRFHDIIRFIAPRDLLIVNDTRVIPGRLTGHRVTGGSAELLLLERTGDGLWWSLARPAKKLMPGAKFLVAGQVVAEIVEAGDGGRRLVRLSGDEQQILSRYGQLPLPPYITAAIADGNRYQTVYADREGSAAAPTAGLHFTRELLDQIRELGATVASITLHIGVDTFAPIRSDMILDHKMHNELFTVSSETIQAVELTRNRGGRVIAVGTTVVRAMESLPVVAGGVVPYTGTTDLYITPGFRFQVIDALITNFHLPRSTLLVLVTTFAGRELICRAYREAIENRYRFYSLGDAMFIQ